MLIRIWTFFVARNKEFFRDHSSLGWSILFPFLVVVGFSMMFSENGRHTYHVAMVGATDQNLSDFKAFQNDPYIDLISTDSLDTAMFKLKHHGFDMVIEPASGNYWISETSPNSYVVEKIFLFYETPFPQGLTRHSVTGHEVPYVEWLFPGILGMNMMFSALFGVGYVVVRYRKNGVLKRLSATPMRAHEYLVSQILSRVVTMLITTGVVYIGCMLLYGFECRGSFLLLIVVFFLGSFALISLGLLVAARISSEELAGGLLNLMSWPMMFLSGVWFSLEGAKPWVQSLSTIFPLTHLIDASRKIMNDGAGIMEIRVHLLVLLIMSLVFLILGSLLFEWKKT